MFNADVWLLKNCVISYKLTPLTTTPTMLYPRDPMRAAIFVPTAPNNTLMFYFGTPPGTDAMIGYGLGSGPPVFTRRDFGDLLTEPIFVWVQSGPVASGVMATVSYEPTRYARYMRYFDELFPK